MICINERIRKLRKILSLNQTEFGNRIGVKQTTIAGYETGAKNPLDSVILSICREFHVNESWLRTGEGGDENMFIHELLEDEYMTYVTEIGNGASDIVKKAIIKYGRLSPEDRKIIDNALEIAIKMIKEE